MTCIVSYTDGQLPIEYPSIQAAVAALLAEYPEGVVFDALGREHDADDEDFTYDVAHGRAALVWATEAESVNDPGANAVAEIEVTQS